MRKILLTALLLAVSLRAQNLRTQEAPTLESQLQAIATAHRGQVALFAEDLQTHQTVSITPDLPVQTASVIKLAILYEALEQIRDGKAHFEDAIPLTRAEQVGGSGILHFFDTPKTLTFKDVLTFMVILSDNTATNLAIDHLGLASINARIATLGLKQTYLYKKVFTPVPAGTTLPPDFKQFGLGKTTPHEIVTLMTKLITCDLGAPARPDDQALCATTTKMLQNQFYRSAAPRYLDRLPGYADSSVANKTGSLDAVRVDVAAISTKQGVIVLSVFTFNNADHTWGADQEGEITIAKMTRAIVDRWSPQGLAPWPTGPIVIDK